MTIYVFKHNETGEYFEADVPMSELDTFKREHPELTQVLTTGGFISGRYSLTRDPDMREKFRRLKKFYPGSTIRD